MDTIYALSSGALPAGVAVVRVSGPETRTIAAALCGAVPEPRVAALRTLVDPAGGGALDRAIVIWFPAPRSFTGEDLCEFQLHGGRAVVAAALRAIHGAGGRAAEAGEFSRRAFVNGKLDLSEIEGLADLIAAQTEAQRRQALRQSGGELRRAAERWRAELIDLRAAVEARLDFSDESDVPQSLGPDFWARIGMLRAALVDALRGAAQGELVREGLRVAILGRPNAGKSSLLNMLAKRDVAIVSDEPGTTRDLVEVALDLQGHKVVLVDTAGVRETTSPAEQEGVARALRAGRTADLALWLESADEETQEALPFSSDREVWRIRSKLDLVGGRPEDGLGVSSLTGEGVEALLRSLKTVAESSTETSSESLLTRERHRECISEAVGLLHSFQLDSQEEVLADLLRRAGDAIGRMTGRFDIEAVLDRIFSEFCIGK